MTKVSSPFPPPAGGVVSVGVAVALAVSAVAAVALLSSKPKPVAPTAPQLRIPEKQPPRLISLPTKRDG